MRRTSLGAITSEQVRQLRLQVLAHEGQLAHEQTRRLAVPASDDLFATHLKLRTQLAELKDARRVPAEVITPAPERGAADHANTEVPMTSDAALGLLVGCFVGAVRDRSRGTRLDPEENQDAE